MFRMILFVAALVFGALPASAHSRDMFQQLRSNFDTIDANGDGVISRAEYRNVLAARWRQIDSNGDGYLTEDDFPTGAARRAKAQLAEIAYLDENGDGRISQSEFLDGPAPAFMQADRNSDGALTRSEIEEATS